MEEVKKTRKRSKKVDLVEVNAVEVSPEEELIAELKNDSVFGEVVGCKSLRVRKIGSQQGEIVGFVNEGVKVSINESESNNEFYKIKFENLEGYCMKKFIKV